MNQATAGTHHLNQIADIARAALVLTNFEYG
jgi:hypothetical protein